MQLFKLQTPLNYNEQAITKLETASAKDLLKELLEAPECDNFTPVIVHTVKNNCRFNVDKLVYLKEQDQRRRIEAVDSR